MTEIREVTIPRYEYHAGCPSNAVTVRLIWTCPKCGGPRGEPFQAFSYDGSHRLSVDGWKNECGHIDLYRDVIRYEAMQGV